MNKIDYAFYLVTDRNILGQRDLCKAVAESIKGGATVVQLREKFIDDEKFLALAKALHKVTKKYKIPLIINDNIKIAKQADAEGLHIGQSDATLEEARKILGKDKIIGVSVSTLEEARNAEAGGADYLGIGTVFFTGSKKDIKEPLGLENLKKIAASVKIPSVAIGGIHLDNIKEVMASGVAGVAVISEILGKEDIEKASRTLFSFIKQYKKWT